MEVNEDNFDAAFVRARALIDTGEITAALELADTCTGDPRLVLQLRAVVYSAARSDREALLQAVELWRQLPTSNPEVAFQLASALQGIVELTVRHEGFSTAIERERHRLREARLLYLEAARHSDATQQLRLVALVNAANLFDLMGRDVDALRCYDEALAIDDGFGMALGNRAMALVRVAPFMDGHQNHVLEDAAWLFDRALEDEQRVIEIGGQGALTTFRNQRARIGSDGPPREPESRDVRFEDPHAQWAFDQGLLLHLSPTCLSHESTSIDPLHLGRMVVGIAEEEQDRLKQLRDAFNTVKQDFLAARYTLWLAAAPDSPIRDQTRELSSRGYFADTLTYARWGIRTGMGIQAMTAATNTLDKIAGLVHLYFRTGRDPKRFSFNQLWHLPRVRNQPATIEPVFNAQLQARPNMGLVAILDLSCDVSDNEHRTPLKEQVARRHAATHRYLVAHDLPMYEPDETGWLTRLDWSEIVEGTIEQLRVTRAALIYFARAIADHEDRRDITDQVIPPLPSYPVEDFDIDP
jgi:tetratricopeptide (TPR) repeat protein